jgi:hypothetical protein
MLIKKYLKAIAELYPKGIFVANRYILKFINNGVIGD